MMTWLILVAGVLGGATGRELVRRLSDRRRSEALTKRITQEANELVYASYRELIEDLRRDAELARHEARDARAEAREANRRSAEAESVAASASESAARAQLSLAEVRRLVVEHVPDADELIRQIERVAARGKL